MDLGVDVDVSVSVDANVNVDADSDLHDGCGRGCVPAQQVATVKETASLAKALYLCRREIMELVVSLPVCRLCMVEKICGTSITASSSTNSRSRSAVWRCGADCKCGM